MAVDGGCRSRRSGNGQPTFFDGATLLPVYASYDREPIGSDSGEDGGRIGGACRGGQDAPCVGQEARADRSGSICQPCSRLKSLFQDHRPQMMRFTASRRILAPSVAVVRSVTAVIGNFALSSPRHWSGRLDTRIGVLSESLLSSVLARFHHAHPQKWVIRRRSRVIPPRSQARSSAV